MGCRTGRLFNALALFDLSRFFIGETDPELSHFLQRARHRFADPTCIVILSSPDAFEAITRAINAGATLIVSLDTVDSASVSLRAVIFGFNEKAIVINSELLMSFITKIAPET
jgi:hypothetical protein